MQDLPILKLLAAIVGLTAVTSVIMLIPDWNGEQAATQAADIDRLLDISIVLSSFVFAVVVVMLSYSVWRWRAKAGDESDGAPLHGNTRLEIIWTTIPTVIVLALAGLSWVTLDDIEAREDDRLVVDVFAQQFAWSFEYPEEGVSSDELHVPVDRQVEFRMHAYDVIHSFWVPEWRIKKDAVPGITTRAIITPDKLGEYSLVCTELCGIGHSTMRAPVMVSEEADWNTWLGEQDPIPEDSTGGETIPAEEPEGSPGS